jgi:quinol monooxygenase YgiN
MIHVIAVLTAKPGKRDAVLQAFRANVPNVLAEAGCIEYGAAVDVETGLSWQAKHGPDAFVVVEKWADLAALQAHAVAPHMKAFTGQIAELLAERAIYVLDPT